ncbi:alkylbase DNA glycosidase-like protein mag2 isoform X2 [Lycium barbarum]|uniref:alkylbase DNA glycosidase-like protein mag2 isoform X2 n=1 Tax=Lycium barbarum TaxID=112863 RepID=UPI00293EB260|nr:alkylbase DNA glycosidase-like protein mag2 isoform X2 [Lycium barbarum]
MGEQTQIQTKTETPPQPQQQSLPNSDDFPQNPSNPSKIPIRPQKIRKLSSSTPQSSNGKETTKNRRKTAPKSNRVLPQIIKPLTFNGEIDNALQHLRSVDPLLSSLMDTLPPPQFETHHSAFLALSKSILYQQLAYKAGTSIYTRFVSLCGGENAVCPDIVLSLSAQQLKQVGISGRKASYLYDLANKYKSGILCDESLFKMDDRSLFTMLSMVKGIGSWSVDMFMIFSLHRPDVLPVSDLGVRKGVQLLYGLEELPRPSQMEELCEKWKPYRTAGAWYMWRLVEGKGSPTNAAAAPIDGGNVHALQQIQTEQETQQQQQQHQLQLLEPINGIENLGVVT